MICNKAFALTTAILCTAGMLFAEQPDAWPIVYKTDFENVAADGDTDSHAVWRPTDPEAWKIEKTDAGNVYRQYKKQSNYQPPHRSPFNISLLQGVEVGDFQLDARVLSTHEDYGHRDAVLVFGYQDPAHFYYVHFGKETDDHANQIFIVNDKPRVKISTKTSDGTPWDEKWHHVRVVRRAKEGTIEVYFDDMTEPVMTAKDETFKWGGIGLGTFDDTSDWDDVTLRGEKVERGNR